MFVKREALRVSCAFGALSLPLKPEGDALQLSPGSQGFRHPAMDSPGAAVCDGVGKGWKRLARLSTGIFVRLQVRKGSLKCSEETCPKRRSEYSSCPKVFAGWAQRVAVLAAVVARLCRGDRRQTLLAVSVQF